MKTIYIAPKNRINGTLGASHINSFCTQVFDKTVFRPDITVMVDWVVKKH